MDTLDPIVRGADWRYIHTVTIDGGGSIAACAAITMCWKYDPADDDADAAVTLTWLSAGGGSGITVLSDTTFSAVIPHAKTRTLRAKPLYVGVKYQLLDGTEIPELGLDPDTMCIDGIPLDMG